MIDTRNLRSIHPSHESERLLAELRTVLRAELMQEFRIGPPPMRRWGLLPCGDVTKLESAGEVVRFRYRAQPQSPARIVRLCIEQEHARHWMIQGLTLGCEPLLLGVTGTGLSATAFPPVPKWLVEGSPDELMRSLARVGEGREDLAETVRALLEAFPVQNVPPMTAQPGLELAVVLHSIGSYEHLMPGVWFLCELPSDAPGGVPFGFRAPWA